MLFKPAAIFALLLAAVPAARAQVARAQVLEIATDQSPVGLDPQVATSFATQLITSTIYEGLTAIDSDLHVVPALAQSWTVSDDGRTYNFQLRPGATFHNGRALTPADIVASFARVRDPKTGSPYASRFTGITAVEPNGNGAIRITLDQPSAPFLAQLASLAIIPPEATADLARHPVGTGPFKFREWVPDTDIALDRNSAYWEQGLPKLTGLKFNIVPEAATRQLGIQSGTYRMVPTLDAATAAGLQGQSSVKVLQTQDLAYSLIGLNSAKAPFDKPEVREAVNLALDRAQMIDAAYFGQAVPAGPLSPALKDWALPTTSFDCYHPDAAKARQKLQAAGLALPVKITINVLGSLQQVVDIAQVVQAQMNQAGFDVALNVQEQGRFIQDWRAGNFQAFASLNSGGADPDDYFGRTFATGGATNVFKYSNPVLDKLLADARTSRNQAQRKQLYDQAQQVLACQGPAVHLAYGTLFTAVRADLQGFQPNPTRSLRGLRDATIAP
jgi:peptide/nickel transport system substrate-binding protein